MTVGKTLFVCLASAALLLPTLRVAAVDPAHARNLTVYHINQLSAGPVPLNMDVGDAAGDLFFDMFEVIPYAIKCPQGPATPSHSHHHNNCVNAETYGDGLVVNKVTLEVDERFSGYAKCNVGNNGTDGHGHPCKDGEYCCYCEDYHEYEIPCNSTIGFENISSFFNSPYWHCELWNASDPQELAECWEINAVKKLGGDEYYGGWYSALDVGCADPVHPTDNCTWRVVSVDAVINRTCHSEKFFEAVAKYNQTCFDGCPGTNSSDFCHVQCFYETAYGPGGSVSGGVVTPDTGVPTSELVQAWLSGFRDEAEGGCPRVAPPAQFPPRHHQPRVLA